jgi:hypothetical protein
MDNAKEIADMIITSCLKACIAAQVTTSNSCVPRTDTRRRKNRTA